MLDKLSELTSGELRQLRGTARCENSTREAAVSLVPVDGAHLAAGPTSAGNVVLSLLGSGWERGEHSCGLVQ